MARTCRQGSWTGVSHETSWNLHDLQNISSKRLSAKGKGQMIKKVKGGYVVLHHQPGPKYGTRIDATKKPVSKKKAEAIHKAIMAGRKK